MVGDFNFKQYHGKNRFRSPLLVYSDPVERTKTTRAPKIATQDVSSVNVFQSLYSTGMFSLNWTDKPDCTDFVFSVKTLGLQNIWGINNYIFCFSELLSFF